MIDLLTMYTITTGLLPTLTCIGSLVAYLAGEPHSLVDEAFDALISKVYVNTLLATLNSRESVSRKAANTPYGTQALPSMEFRPPHDPSTTFEMTSDVARE